MKDLLKLCLFILMVWAIIEGAGGLVILFWLFVGALLLKCMK